MPYEDEGVRDICSINYLCMNLTCFKNIEIIVFYIQG